MASLTHQNTKNATYDRVFRVCVLPTCRLCPIHRHQPPLAHPTCPPPAKSNSLIPNTSMCPQGHILVFPSPSLVQDIIFYHSLCQGCCQHPRYENATPVSHFRVWGVPAPFLLPSTTLPTAQTRRMWPHGRVLRVWDIPAPFPPPRDKECDHEVVFFVSGVSLHLLLPRREEHDHRVVFFVSGMLLAPQIWKCDPTVAFFVSRVSLHLSLHPLPPKHEEHNHWVTSFVSGVFPLDPVSHSPCLGCLHLIQTHKCVAFSCPSPPTSIFYILDILYC